MEKDHSVPKKQRHTAKRIFERLRDEYGFGGGYTSVSSISVFHRQSQPLPGGRHTLPVHPRIIVGSENPNNEGLICIEYIYQEAFLRGFRYQRSVYHFLFDNKP